MGNSLASESKLMFYPTSQEEIYKMLPFVGRISIDYFKKQMLKQQIGDEEHRKISILSLDNNIEFEYAFYYYCLANNRYDLIKQYITINYETSDSINPIVICDYFAGEGEFLEIFKTFIPVDKSNYIHLIANELEEHRYDKIKEKNIVNEYTNLAFEYTQYPKHHASLILYNPPYGETNKERNAKYYLKKILERQLIYHNQDSKNFKGGSIICVLRGDDILDCAKLLVQNFNIQYNNIYKTEDEEFQKYKQFILIGTLRREPLDENNRYEAIYIQEGIDKIKEAINNQNEFSLSSYRYINKLKLYSVPYKQMKENFKYVQQQNKYVSNKDNAWNWIQDITKLNDLSMEKLVLPKEPKIGELSLIIASGAINGQLDLDDDKAKHIAIGGVKPMIKQESETKIDDKTGEKYIETKTVKYTQPFLNLLVNNYGKIEIKELGGEE